MIYSYNKAIIMLSIIYITVFMIKYAVFFLTKTKLKVFNLKYYFGVFLFKLLNRNK